MDLNTTCPVLLAMQAVYNHCTTDSLQHLEDLLRTFPSNEEESQAVAQFWHAKRALLMVIAKRAEKQGVHG